MADALIREFGSLPAVFAAGGARQYRVTGSDAAVAILDAARNATRRITAARLESRPVLSGSRDVRDYLIAHLAYEPVETVRVLYLDEGRRLLADEQTGRGSPIEAPFYVRTVLGRAIELSASTILVAHNHPSGRSGPSEADVAITAQLIDAARTLGIAVLDHLVVTRHEVVSVLRAATGLCTAARAPVPALVADGSRMRTPDAGHDEPLQLDRSALLRGIIKLRRRRDELFPPKIFFDPCWDILLDLYANELEGADVSVNGACLASTVPVSTALRWVKVLVRAGLVRRELDPNDKRRTFLRLTPDGRERMIRFVRMTEAMGG